MNNHTKLPLQRITHDETNTNRCTGSRLFVTRIDAAFIQNKVNKKTKNYPIKIVCSSLFFFFGTTLSYNHTQPTTNRV